MHRRCDGIPRRDFVRAGAAGLLAAAWGRGARGARGEARARRCVLIWLDGGPSHLETWDLKPEAPAEVRGPFAPVETQLPGMRICEHMPRLAGQARRLAVIRSLTSPLGEHNFGAHYLLTGYKPTPALEYPSVGSIVASQRPAGGAVLPRHIAVPRYRVGGGNFSGNGFLPPATQPFSVGGDPAKPDFRVEDLDFFPGVGRQRIARRRRYLSDLDGLQRQIESAAGEQSPAALDPHFEQAFRLITTPAAKRAFQLQDEPADVKRRYGPRTIGQSCLLARRLLERDVPFVTVNYTGWDTHENAYTRLKEGYTGAKVPVGLIPNLDQAVSALIDDLDRGGLLDSTLIAVMGEFGRTPKLNTRGGRDHWPRVFSAMLAGAGIEGQVIGASDATGESPRERPVTPADLAATVLQLLGVPPERTLHTPDGRPVRASTGTPLTELL